MAVPPIQSTRAVAAGPTGLVRTLGVSLMLDVVLGLLVAVALPLAIVAIPNTISVVAALLPPDISQIEMIRAHGLALPAMVLTVPLAVMAVRRMRAAPILVAGLILLALADVAGGFADSTMVVGVLRVLHGIGAGLLVPATLVAVWTRSRFLRAIWAAVLAMSLLAAQALALWPLDEVDSWRVTLQPYPMLTGVALALAALYLVLWLKNGEIAITSPRPIAAERGRLLMAVVPATGIAVLALGSTFDWSPRLVVLAALLSILGLLVSAAIGTLEGTDGRVSVYTMLAVGIVILPTAAQVTYVELGGLGGPGLSGLWPAFVIAGAVGVLAAVLVSRLGGGVMPMVTAGGLVVVVAGLCAVRLLLPASGGPTLVLPFVLLAVGTSVALTAALRSSGGGAALFALSLFFPAVLAGFLLGNGIQVTRLRGARTAQVLVDGYVGALHLWALIGGGLVIAVIVLGAALARFFPTDVSGMAGSSMEVCAVAGAEPLPVEKQDHAGVKQSSPVVTEQCGPAGAETAPQAGTRGGRLSQAEPGQEHTPKPIPKPVPLPEPEKTTAPPVVVPPPTQSPEDGRRDGQARP